MERGEGPIPRRGGGCDRIFQKRKKSTVAPKKRGVPGEQRERKRRGIPELMPLGRGEGGKIEEVDCLWKTGNLSRSLCKLGKKKEKP